jgi:hypothetical protein
MTLVRPAWVKSVIARFNEFLPNETWISDTKKLDFLV